MHMHAAKSKVLLNEGGCWQAWRASHSPGDRRFVVLRKTQEKKKALRSCHVREATGTPRGPPCAAPRAAGAALGRGTHSPFFVIEGLMGKHRSSPCTAPQAAEAALGRGTHSPFTANEAEPKPMNADASTPA
jgi:hypothetical protein